MYTLHQPANKISDETLELFRKVLENDLKLYGSKLAREKGLDDSVVLDLIPSVLQIPIIDKINAQYLDTSLLKFKKELNKYSLADLKEICRQKGVKITGTRDELMNRIADHIGLVEPTTEELDKSKSFKSKPLKNRKKLKGNIDLDETPNHYVSDSE